MTVKEIFDYLNSLYPVSDAMDFDNVGILVGDPEKLVNKALVVLDCTLDAVKIAVEKGCQLIISHHPVIFNPLKNLLKGSVQYELIKKSIAVISMHTNLDIGVGGVNDTLCNIIGVSEAVSFPAYDGYTIKKGIVPFVSASDLAKSLKKRLGGCVKYVDGGRPINKILVCGGSGGNYIEDAISGKFDALITSDVKHHHFLLAADNGISLFDAGHFHTEDVVVDPLKQLLQNQFKQCEFTTYHPNIFNFE